MSQRPETNQKDKLLEANNTKQHETQKSWKPLIDSIGDPPCDDLGTKNLTTVKEHEEQRPAGDVPFPAPKVEVQSVESTEAEGFE